MNAKELIDRVSFGENASVVCEASSVDPLLFDTRSKFGSAGGPDEYYLTDFGLERTAKIAAGISVRDESALREMPINGDPLFVEENFSGAKWRVTPWGKKYMGNSRLVLLHKGYIESDPSDNRGSAYRITDVGRQALKDIDEERDHLLTRIQS